MQRLSKDYKTLEPLSSVEWNIVNDYISLMSPIAESLDRLQGEKNVSIGSVLPCLYFIESKIASVELKTKHSNSPRIQCIGREMQEALVKAFKKRFESFMTFSETNRTLIVAAVSQPVYKTKWILNERNILIAKSFFEQEIQRLHENNQALIDSVVECEDPDEDEFLPRESLASTRRLSSDNNSEVAAEILHFLEDRDKNVEMLKKYPTIEKVYRKFNTTLSASAPIERLFSQALIIFTPRRNRISDSNFERALLLKQNKFVQNN